MIALQIRYTVYGFHPSICLGKMSDQRQFQLTPAAVVTEIVFGSTDAKPYPYPQQRSVTINNVCDKDSSL